MVLLRFCFLILLLSAGNIVYSQNEIIDFSRLNLRNAQVVDRPVWGNGFAVSFRGGTTSASYYTRGNAIRIYDGGSVTVSSLTKRITGLVLTFSEKKYAPNSKAGKYTNTGTLTIGKSVVPWNGATADGVTSVTLTRPVSGGQWQLQKIEVTFGNVISDSDKVVARISSVGYSTLYYGNTALIVPPNVHARTYKLSDQRLSVSRVYFPGDVIAAATAVVLDGEPGDHSFVVARHYREAAGESDNLLQGTDTEEYLAEDANSLYYQLSLNAENEAGTVGFYWGAANGGAFINGAHKAFLKVPRQNVSAAKSLYLFRDEATGLNKGMSVGKAGENCSMFNLYGQRVGRNYRGIVVIKNKKFIAR